MKNYTHEEIATAKRQAYSFAFSTAHIVLRHRFKYDRRTRIGNLANSFFQKMKIEKEVILAKKKSRANNRPATFKNVLSNPLVLDFKRNSPCQIYIDHLRFGQRNHWAKSNLDFKILAILKTK